MFIMGISNYSALVFSLFSMLVAVPSAIKIFNWSATMYKGSITFDTPMLYAFSFIGLFTIGGLTGVFLASLGMDIHLTETYFIVAHFHYVMVGGMVSAVMAGHTLLVAQDYRQNVSGSRWEGWPPRLCLSASISPSSRSSFSATWGCLGAIMPIPRNFRF